MKGSSSGQRNQRNKGAAKTHDQLKSDCQVEAGRVVEDMRTNERASSRNPKSGCTLTLKKSANNGAISSVGSDANKNTVEVSSEEEHRVDNALAAHDNADTDESAEECLSTDGEESDPDSPFYPESQYLN